MGIILLKIASILVVLDLNMVLQAKLSEHVLQDREGFWPVFWSLVGIFSLFATPTLYGIGIFLL